MEKRLQEMLDHYEIRKLIGEYCHGVDRMDQVRTASVYAQRSWDDHGIFRGPGQEFAEFVTERMKTGTSVGGSHMLGQTLIRVDGDEAGAETYFIATNVSEENEECETLSQLGGRYVDTLVRENGCWKVKKRICVRDWSISLPLANDWLAGVEFVQARRSNDDPSFAALGIEHSGIPGE